MKSFEDVDYGQKLENSASNIGKDSNMTLKC